jgi:hypothetical protein
VRILTSNGNVRKAEHITALHPYTPYSLSKLNLTNLIITKPVVWIAASHEDLVPPIHRLNMRLVDLNGFNA